MEEFSRRRNVRRPDNGKKVSGLTPLTAKLMICLAIFAIAIAVRLLYGTETVKTAVLENIDKDAGYAEVFSDIGRALTDSEGLQSFFEDGTVPVFGQQDLNEEEQENTDESTDTLPQQIDDTQEDRQEQDSSDLQDDITPTQQPEEDITPTIVPENTEQKYERLALEYSGEDDVDDTPPTLFQISPPDNVSLEKPSLGFSFSIPLKGSISSPFGYRDHPIDDDTKFHFGIDIAASPGAAIVAFADGKVIKKAYNNINGYYLFIEHKNGFKTVYCHCSKLLVKVGDTVKKGEKIALVGSTGAATGPHLHFELRFNDKTLNPSLYFNPELL